MAKKTRIDKEIREAMDAELENTSEIIERTGTFDTDINEENEIVLKSDEFRKKDLFFGLLKELYNIDVWDETQPSFSIEIEGYDKVKLVENEIENPETVKPVTVVPILSREEVKDEETDKKVIIMLTEKLEKANATIEDLRLQLKNPVRNIKSPKIKPVMGGKGYYNSDMYGQVTDSF